MEVKGRNLAEGIPALVHHLVQRDPRGAHRSRSKHRVGVKSALEQTPPELGADIAEKAWSSPGRRGAAARARPLLMEETGLPVIVADDPLTCVVAGSGRALEEMDKLGTGLHERLVK
jgi:rod shape-determining protein MreB